jgi:hypothetical protein
VPDHRHIEVRLQLLDARVVADDEILFDPLDALILRDLARRVNQRDVPL